MSGLRAAVITVSDSCAAGEAEDMSGPRLAARLAALPAEIVGREVVPDDVARIAAAVEAAAATADVVALTGGTGLAPRDRTPEAVRPLLDYEVPGMAEAMRAHGLAQTANAVLSRELVGVRGACLVMALPGSVRAVDDSLDAVWAALPHALDQLRGGGAHGAR